MENTFTLSYVPRVSELVQLRKALGYSTQKLANALEMNRSELSQIENGKRGISHEKFVKIYNFLNKQKTKNKKPLYKICSKNITSVKPNDSLKKAKEIMAKNKFDENLSSRL
jgi:predicted transcriptional regulator